jgi:hypothetical protein
MVALTSKGTMTNDTGVEASNEEHIDVIDRTTASKFLCFETGTLPVVRRSRVSGGLTKNGSINIGEEELGSDRKDRESRERQHREIERRGRETSRPMKLETRES